MKQPSSASVRTVTTPPQHAVARNVPAKQQRHVRLTFDNEGGVFDDATLRYFEAVASGADALPMPLPVASPASFAQHREAYMRAFDRMVRAAPTDATSRALQLFLHDVFESTGLTMSTLFALPPVTPHPPPTVPSSVPSVKKKGRVCEVCGRFANYGFTTKRWCADHAKSHPGAKRL